MTTSNELANEVRNLAIMVQSQATEIESLRNQVKEVQLPSFAKMEELYTLKDKVEAHSQADSAVIGLPLGAPVEISRELVERMKANISSALNFNLPINLLSSKAEMPKYATDGSAGFDLIATSKYTDEYGNLCYGTGIAVAIPRGYVGLLVPRSSVSKTQLSLANSVGIIDSDYRGELTFKFIKHWDDSEKVQNSDDDYDEGSRVGQLVIVAQPLLNLVQVDSLDTTARGDGGFGSTGE